MLRGCVLVLLLSALLLAGTAEAGWFRRWRGRKILSTAIKVAPYVLPHLGKRDVAALDANGDGVLDVEELANHVGARASRDDLEEFMDLMDNDGDGQVTRRELEDFAL